MWAKMRAKGVRKKWRCLVDTNSIVLVISALITLLAVYRMYVWGRRQPVMRGYTAKEDRELTVLVAMATAPLALCLVVLVVSFLVFVVSFVLFPTPVVVGQIASVICVPPLATVIGTSIVYGFFSIARGFGRFWRGEIV
jgi:hypothetical protein